MKKYFFILFAIFLVGLVTYYHNADNGYLAKKNADEAWNKFLPTLNEIVNKGDYINFKAEHSDNEIWNIYNQRFSYFIETINKQNAPRMRHNFLLQTNYRDFKSRSSIEFYVYDEITKQLIETKIISSKTINFLSLLPPLVIFILLLFTSKLSFSLLIGIGIASALISKSIINGILFIFTKHIPSAFFANNFYLIKLILFLFLIHSLIYLISYTGGFKALQNLKNTRFKYLYYPLFAIHPYLFSSLGVWFINSIKKYKSFISHVLALVFSYLLIISPNNLNLISNSLYEIDKISLVLVNLLKYKFFSFSLLIILFYFLKTKKSLSSNKTYSSFFSDKIMLKKTFFITNIAIFSFFILFYLNSLLIGIINIEFNSNFKSIIFNSLDIISKLINFELYINYFRQTDIYLALITSCILALIICTSFMYKKKRIYLNEIINSSSSVFKLNIKYSLYLILTYIYIMTLEDLGTAHYIISLFNNKIDPVLLSPLCFLISIIIGLIFGNSLFVISFLPAIMIPIAKQVSDISSIIIYTSIVEGAIAGELLCPYSPTSIIVSSIYQKNPLIHIKNQFKIVLVAVFVSFIIGFLHTNTNIPFYIFYLLITVSTILFFLKKTNKTD